VLECPTPTTTSVTPMSNESPTGRAPTAPAPQHIKPEGIRQVFQRSDQPYAQVNYSALEIRLLAECTTVYGAWASSKDDE